MNGQPAELRARILEAAVQLFTRNGYHATSVREIIELVGVSKGGFYHHFATKEALFVGVVERQLLGLTEGFARADADANRSVEERLRAVFLVPLGRDPSYYALLSDGVRSSDYVRNRVAAIMGEALRRCERLLKDGQASGAVREMIDCPSWAFHILSLVEGAFFVASVGGAGSLRENLSRLYENTWRNIKALSL
ncbi:MAG TPA: TetR/AcrR family transcriptional regulator [Spirochaetia bacterium]|nr:TetR/AcrR family transcriptional regulator [Spirochaetia bacterium]